MFPDDAGPRGFWFRTFPRPETFAISGEINFPEAQAGAAGIIASRFVTLAVK
jgi:hypothetical protein